MPKPLLEALDSLPDMSDAELTSLWRKLNGKSASIPPVRRGLLIRILVHRLQEQTHGGLSRETQQQLNRLIGPKTTAPDAASFPSPQPTAKLKLGTRLIRQWGDKAHEVTVIESGFAYAGRKYKSLSEIARLITGTRWSGPVFFGLRRLTSPNPTATTRGEARAL